MSSREPQAGQTCRGRVIALDVAYDEARGMAHAAGVLFADWPAAHPRRIVRVCRAGLAPYTPGQLWRRELPALLGVLAEVGEPLSAMIVDGYVWLDAAGRAGLGAHLFAATAGSVPVVGVAKSRFRGDDVSVPVLRGRSLRPLHVTAAGMDAGEAAARVRSMHGPHRIPTLLQLADQAARRLP